MYAHVQLELSPADGLCLVERMTLTYTLGVEHGLYPGLKAFMDGGEKLEAEHKADEKAENGKVDEKEKNEKAKEDVDKEAKEDEEVTDDKEDEDMDKADTTGETQAAPLAVVDGETADNAGVKRKREDGEDAEDREA